jgi:hypothetical protein
MYKSKWVSTRIIPGQSFLAMKPAIPERQPNFRASYCRSVKSEGETHRCGGENAPTHTKRLASECRITLYLYRGILRYQSGLPSLDVQKRPYPHERCFVLNPWLPRFRQAKHKPNRLVTHNPFGFYLQSLYIGHAHQFISLDRICDHS